MCLRRWPKENQVVIDLARRRAKQQASGDRCGRGCFAPHAAHVK